MLGKSMFFIPRILLESGSDPNQQCSKKNTSLHIASQVNDEVLIKLLLKYGAKPHLQNEDK